MAANWRLSLIFSIIRLFTIVQVENKVNSSQVKCQGAVTFCGVRDSLYPDKRPLGFPFDRQGDFQTLHDFVYQEDKNKVKITTNMIAQDVKITFQDLSILAGDKGKPTGKN